MAMSFNISSTELLETLPKRISPSGGGASPGGQGERSPFLGLYLQPGCFFLTDFRLNHRKANSASFFPPMSESQINIRPWQKRKADPVLTSSPLSELIGSESGLSYGDRMVLHEERAYLVLHLN